MTFDGYEYSKLFYTRSDTTIHAYPIVGEIILVRLNRSAIGIPTSDILRVGWGALCTAGGGAYFFAKQSIDSDRRQRRKEQSKRQQMQDRLEHSATSAITTPSSRTDKKTTTVINRSLEGQRRRVNDRVDMQATLTDHTLPPSDASIHMRELDSGESK